MNTVAWTPASRAAHATACPWLPALAVTTPAARWSAPSEPTLLTAPRILNDPVRWRFSALRTIARPASRPSVAEGCTGVTRAMPATRDRAASMSARLGAVRVTNVEHPLHDLPDGAQRVELAPLNLVEQPPQLGVALDGLLEVRLRAGARDGEHLAGEVPGAPLREKVVVLEVAPVLLDSLPELVDTLPAQGLGQHDRGS